MKVGVALPLVVWLWGQWNYHQANKGMGEGKPGEKVASVRSRAGTQDLRTIEQGAGKSRRARAAWRD